MGSFWVLTPSRSSFAEIFSRGSNLAETNRLWIIFENFQFSRKWDTQSFLFWPNFDRNREKKNFLKSFRLLPLSINLHKTHIYILQEYLLWKYLVCKLMTWRKCTSAKYVYVYWCPLKSSNYLIFANSLREFTKYIYHQRSCHGFSVLLNFSWQSSSFWRHFLHHYVKHSLNI